MVLAMAGPIRHERNLRLSEKYFSNLLNGVTPISKNHFIGSISENQIKPQFLFQHDSDSQIELQICFRSCSYNHENFLTLGLISRIFDDGFTSRLQRVLREERGLVYSVECRATSMSDIGTMDFDVTVRPEKLIEVSQVLIQEIKNFILNGPSDEEVAHVKKRYMFDLDSEIDDPCKQVIRYAFPHLYSEEMSLEEERNQVMEISKDKIVEVAKRTFSKENLNLILVGPFTPELKHDVEHLIEVY
jgi:predicted Zn-dependent peptidase